MSLSERRVADQCVILRSKVCLNDVRVDKDVRCDLSPDIGDCFGDDSAGMTGVAGMGVIVEAYSARVVKSWAMDVGGERKSGVDLRERVSGNWQCMRPEICNGICNGRL